MIIAKTMMKWLLVMAALILAVFAISRNNEPVRAMDDVDTTVVANALLEPESFPLLSTNVLDNSCRFGASGPNAAFDWTDTFGIGWLSDYGARNVNMGSAAYTPIVRLSQLTDDTYRSVPTLEAMANMASQNPGRVWQVGNEPEVLSQDAIEPELYVQAYHDIYNALK